jgi:hypothetical protein
MSRNFCVRKPSCLARCALPALMAALALAACGCLGPSQSELESYEKRISPAVGDVLPLEGTLDGRLAFADAVSAAGSFLEVDQKLLLAALRQRRIFKEVVDLGREGTPAAAKEKGFAFFLRFTEGRYHRHSLHHHENRLGRYELIDLATGASRQIDLDVMDDERILYVQPAGPQTDTGRDHGVDSRVKIRALVEAVERATRSMLSAQGAGAGR